MKLTLLGTGACEGIPSLWCDCPVCRRAREHGGRDARRRTAFLINDDTLIDFGPDIKAQCLDACVDPRKLRRVLVTHSHIDHFQVTDLLWRSGEMPELKLIANRRVHEIFLAEARNAEDLRIKLVPAVPGEELCDGRLSILPIRAAHAPGEIALTYLLTGEDNAKALILADTGFLPEESLRLLEGCEADAAVIEASFGIRPPYSSERATHLGAEAVFDLRRELIRRKALKPNAFVAVTHISHCSGVTHADLEQFFAGTGIVPGYDGMTVTVGGSSFREQGHQRADEDGNPSVIRMVDAV